MTEPGPFAPPSGALTPRPPEPVAPVNSPAPPLPPPAGLPIGAAPRIPQQVVSAPPPRRRWLIPVIIGGSLVLLLLVGGVVFAAVQIARSIGTASPFAEPFAEEPEIPESEELLEGAPGSPVATDPLLCAVCFGHDQIAGLDAPGQAYTSLGLPLSSQDTGSGQAGTEHRANYDAWRTQDGSPDDCFFSFPYAPIASPESDFMLSSDPGYDDEVYYYGYNSSNDQYYVLTTTGRLFDDTATASAHMADLDRFLDDCTAYTTEDDYGEYSVHLQEAPAIEVPSSVAAMAWSQTTDWGRFYTVDLQRGNVVVRLSLNSDGYGPTEAEFRRFIEEYARQLAALEPAA